MMICPIDAEKITKLIRSEIHIHPFIEPVDLYKLLYQALYGPFHIVRDFKRLCMNISKELWIMQNDYYPIFQEIGPCYTRISLSSIKRVADQLTTINKIETLARWILESCVLYEDVREDFRLRWQCYRDILHDFLPSTPDSWEIADKLAEQGKLPSHSKLFHEHYDPHYRLVDTSLKEHLDRFMELNK